MPANQARRDLKEKLVFERQLLRKIGRLFNNIARDMAKRLKEGGEILNADSYREEIEDILLKHYIKVAKVFGTRIIETLPKDIAATDAEKNKIKSALDIFFISHAGIQAHIITRTNQEDINRAILKAQETEELQPEQKALSVPEIALLAALNLKKSFTARALSIAAYETQLPAETAKGIEGQVLSGQEPSVTAGSRRSSNVKKEWVSIFKVITMIHFF